jgi:DNA-binding GntR family transcriptional regulator
MTQKSFAIPRAALHEQVAQRLRQMLVESRIAPGAKLNERELAEVLHVSRTPLREAIKMLAAEGLVELLPNRGAIAVELDEADVLNTFEVMAGLEAHVRRTRRPAHHRCRAGRDPAMHFEMMAAYTGATFRLLPAQSPHPRAINAAAKNPVLAATYDQVNARLQRCASAPTRTRRSGSAREGTREDDRGPGRRDAPRDAPGAAGPPAPTSATWCCEQLRARAPRARSR